MNENTQKEIEKLRKQISQQEKMASLGLLSAGIAHEIQNPLNFVINFSKVSQKLLKDMQEVLDELGDALPEDSVEEIKEIMSDLESNMNKIEENGNRASGIVRGILLYSRGKDDEYIPTDLHQLTKEYVWLSYHAVKANNKSFNVAIQEEYAVDLPLVKVIPQDFSRAILNLMNNACYAVFSKSKEIADATYQPTIRICLKKEGDRINLSIEDNGFRKRQKRNSIRLSSRQNRSVKAPVSDCRSLNRLSNKNITVRSEWIHAPANIPVLLFLFLSNNNRDKSHGYKNIKCRR